MDFKKLQECIGTKKLNYITITKDNLISHKVYVKTELNNIEKFYNALFIKYVNTTIMDRYLRYLSDYLEFTRRQIYLVEFVLLTQNEDVSITLMSDKELFLLLSEGKTILNCKEL